MSGHLTSDDVARDAAKAVLEYQIGEVLRGYVTLCHEVVNIAGPRSEAFFSVYDVRGHSVLQLSEPKGHAEAQADRVRLQTEAIMKLFEEHLEAGAAS